MDDQNLLQFPFRHVYRNINDSRGGAIKTSAGTVLAIHGSTFTDNQSGRGGSIYNRGKLIVSDSIFFGNTAIDEGGAIALASYASITVTGCIFENNSAGDEGPVLWGECKFVVVEQRSCLVLHA